jgi:hypothetical protein
MFSVMIKVVNLIIFLENEMLWATAIKSRKKFGTTQNKWIFRER